MNPFPYGQVNPRLRNLTGVTINGAAEEFMQSPHPMRPSAFLLFFALAALLPPCALAQEPGEILSQIQAVRMDSQRAVELRNVDIELGEAVLRVQRSQSVGGRFLHRH